MSLTGGKRKVNKSLKAWVTFVKKVQKEEKLSYKDAIHRAKVRKDKGEKWMVGGVAPPTERSLENLTTEITGDRAPTMTRTPTIGHIEATPADVEEEAVDMEMEMDTEMEGGRRRRRKSRRGRMSSKAAALSGGRRHRTRKARRSRRR